jgi:large subunit ribosomal protein L4e
MKTTVFDINGKKAKEIELPKFFTQKIREDLIFKVLETEKSKQPYAPSPVAGKQHAAKGKIVHRRHVWRSGYGRGNSRVPRKIFSQRGNQFNWEAAEVPQARGGMRAHPPKVLGMINTKKLNKKEKQVAFVSALSATASPKYILKKYKSLAGKKIENVPFIIEGKINKVKTKELFSGLKNILGDLFDVALQKKSVRAGRGKMRGRKYKKNAGLLMVIAKEETLKTKGVEIKKVNELGVGDLAKGEPGRLTVYTENAIKELNEKLGTKK